MGEIQRNHACCNMKLLTFIEESFEHMGFDIVFFSWSYYKAIRATVKLLSVYVVHFLFKTSEINDAQRLTRRSRKTW